MANKDELLICDFSQFAQEQEEGIADIPTVGKWTLLPYKTTNFSGSLIFSSNGQSSLCRFRIPLSCEGRYAIYLGTYYGHNPANFFAMMSHLGISGGRLITQIKLNTDAAFDTISDEYYGPKSGHQPEKQINPTRDILEVKWREAELTSDSYLIISNLPHRAFWGTVAGIAYIRLVRIEQTNDFKSENRRLVAMVDSSFFGGSPASKEQVDDFLMPFCESNFDAICWETVKGDECYYPSAIARMIVGMPDPTYTPNYLPDDLRKLMRQGDPLDIYVSAAHDIGLKFFSSMRFMLTRFPYAFTTWPDNPGFFLKNRQFWIKDETGQPMPHISLAFPEIRQRIVALFREQLERYDIDGINILFNRSYPFVLFEEPVLESFKHKYGQDARQVDRMDERLWRCKAEFISALISELRSLADEFSVRKNKKIEVCAIVFNSLRQSLYFGLDIEKWCQQHWVNRLIVHPCFSAEAFDGVWVKPEYISEYSSVCKSADVKLYADFYPRHLPPEKIIPKVIDYYTAGADGIGFWDCYSRFWRKSEWSVIKHAGDVDLLKRWNKQSPIFWRKVQMISFADISLDDRFGAQTHG